MKINVETFVKFLNKVKMSSSQSINDCVMDFKTTGLYINADSTTKQVKVIGELGSSNFKDYEDIGKVCVNDFGSIVNVIGRFEGDVTIAKSANLLKLSGGNKKVNVELVSEHYIEKSGSLPSLEYEDSFNIEMGSLKKIFKDVSMNKDATIIIATGSQKVVFSNTGKYKFTTEFDAPFCSNDSLVEFGKILIDATTNLDGVLNVNIKSDYPLKVVETTDESIITLFIAPLVSE